MLKSLSLRHFALVDQLELDFPKGLHILSGDTGAGKSLIFDAIHLLAGQKSDAIWVREGAPKADIQCEFLLQPERADDLALLERLKYYELEDDENPYSMRLRRVIHSDGRSKAQINGVPVKASILKELTAECFLFHDQHESTELLKADVQMRWLDLYADNATRLDKYKADYDHWHALVKEQNDLIARQRDVAQRKDYLAYQLEEMDGLNLEPEYLQQLEAQVKSQDHAAKWREQGESLLQILSGDNDGIRYLRQWVHQIQSDRNPHPSCTAAASLVETALVHLDEAEGEISGVNDFDFDEETMQMAQETLSKVFDMSRKHQVPVEELHEFKQSIEDELESLDSDTSRLEMLEAEVEKAHEAVMKSGLVLSKARAKAAPSLATMLVNALVPLGMLETQWIIEVNQQETPKPSGLDDVRFLLCPNKGHKPQPLGKIASGGELSRISLVLHAYGRGDVSTSRSQIYCFDEVDVGVSGQVAAAIGALLQELSKESQVFCISHAPQVAAQPGTHWRATKKLMKGQVTTSWAQLDQDGRQEEIARMLGNSTQTEMALAKKLLTNPV